MLPAQQSDTFTPEQVGEIMSIASRLERRTDSERLSWSQMVGLAQELGVSPDVLARALSAWQDGLAHERVVLRKQIRHHAKLDRRAWRFRGHMATYLIAVAGLMLLDWLAGAGWWVQWIAVPWGIVLARQGVRLRMNASAR